MVCLGNICRSPLAEGILKYKLQGMGLDWEVDSAGTNGYHIGEAPHPLSRKVALQHGIDIGSQRARKFTAADLQHFDKVYAMAEDVIDEMRRIAGPRYKGAFEASSAGTSPKVDLLLNELHPGSNEEVPDPWYGPESGYHELYRLISAACDRIVEKYGPPAEPIEPPASRPGDQLGNPQKPAASSHEHQ